MVSESLAGFTATTSLSSSVMSMGVERLGFVRAVTVPVEPELPDELLEVALVLLPVEPREVLFPLVDFPELVLPVVEVRLELVVAVDEVVVVAEVDDAVVADVELVEDADDVDEAVDEVLPEPEEADAVELVAPEPATEEPRDAEPEEPVELVRLAPELVPLDPVLELDAALVAGPVAGPEVVALAATVEVPVFLAPQPMDTARHSTAPAAWTFMVDSLPGLVDGLRQLPILSPPANRWQDKKPTLGCMCQLL